MCTVKFHVANLRKKLGGLNRFQLCLVGVFDLMDLSGSTDLCSWHCPRIGLRPAGRSPSGV